MNYNLNNREGNMRTTTAKKIELIKEGKGRVGECDGGYFFYSNGINSKNCVRISRELYMDLVMEELKAERERMGG